jgi:hypothetical protein
MSHTWRSCHCKLPTTYRQLLAKLSRVELRRAILSLLTPILLLSQYSLILIIHIAFSSNGHSPTTINILLHPPLPSLYFCVAYLVIVCKILRWFPQASCGAAVTVSFFGYFPCALLSPIMM